MHWVETKTFVIRLLDYKKDGKTTKDVQNETILSEMSEGTDPSLISKTFDDCITWYGCEDGIEIRLEEWYYKTPVPNGEADCEDFSEYLDNSILEVWESDTGDFVFY